MTINRVTKVSLLLIPCTIVLVAAAVYWVGQPTTATVLEPNSSQSRLLATTLLPPSAKPLATSCFSLNQLPELSIPKTEEQSDGCVLRAALSQPNGQVTVTLQRITDSSLEQALAEHTGIVLRETQTETYRSFAPPLGTSMGVLTFHKAFATPTELTGFFTTAQQNAIVTVTIHQVARINPEVENHFWRIVAAVTID